MTPKLNLFFLGLPAMRISAMSVASLIEMQQAHSREAVLVGGIEYRRCMGSPHRHRRYILSNHRGLLGVP